METETRTCSLCKQPKPVNEFYPRFKDGKIYYQSHCRPCHRKYVREWQRENVEWCRAKEFRRRYGITLGDYNVVLDDQDGVCAICGKVETRTYRGKVKYLSVDHDHDTGKIRGLLCGNCNNMIGYAKDDIQVLESAIDYLKFHS